MTARIFLKWPRSLLLWGELCFRQHLGMQHNFEQICILSVAALYKKCGKCSEKLREWKIKKIPEYLSDHFICQLDNEFSPKKKFDGNFIWADKKPSPAQCCFHFPTPKKEWTKITADEFLFSELKRSIPKITAKVPRYILHPADLLNKDLYTWQLNKDSYLLLLRLGDQTC